MVFRGWGREERPPLSHCVCAGCREYCHHAYVCVRATNAQISLWGPAFSYFGHRLGDGMAASYVLLLISWGATVLVSAAPRRVTSPRHIPISSCCFLLFLYCSNSGVCEVMFHCGFDFNFCPYTFESLPSLSLKGENLGHYLCDTWVLFWDITGFQVAQVLPPGLKEASSALHGA